MKNHVIHAFPLALVHWLVVKVHLFIPTKNGTFSPSKNEWDLTNGPLSKLLELLDTQVEGSVQWVLLEISWIQGGCHESKYTIPYICTLSVDLG